MGVANQEAIKQLHTLVEQVDETLKNTYENVHQGYPTETLVRFLKARDWNVARAHKMLTDCLEWRIQNDIDDILKKPIAPIDLYRAVRDSHPVGFSGFAKEGHPVVAIGVGLSTYDKASVHYYVQSHIQMNEYRDRVLLPYTSRKYGRYIGTCVKILDMTGLRLSALNQIKLLTAISTIDDLNYPEKTETYYIVNPPRIFSTCWKVVKPLLQERTRRKVQVLQGSPKDELLKIMDYSALPHFCRREGGSGSSKDDDDCFSLDHPFHQQLYNYIKQQQQQQQQSMVTDSCLPIKKVSCHVALPEPDTQDVKIVRTIESEFHKHGERNGLFSSLKALRVRGN